MNKVYAILATILMTGTLQMNHLFAQSGYLPSPENLENREWFQDNRYGMFIHWGIYSVMAGGGEYGVAEWIMNEKEIPVEAYENISEFFNPIEFDAKEWVAVAKKAGMRYITLHLPSEKRIPLETVLVLEFH
jgi:alpha-L-fucosidase